VGIGRRVSVLRRIWFLLPFLFCSPTLALCLLALVFGCLAGFWLCVEQFLFGSFLSIFHSRMCAVFDLFYVLVYLDYVEIGIVLVCFGMLFYVLFKHEPLYFGLCIRKT